MASSTFSAVPRLVSPYLHSIYKNLPAPLQSAVTHAAQSIQSTSTAYLPRPAAEYIARLLSKAEPEYFLAALLPLLILLFSMSSWGRTTRYSPFGAPANRNTTISDNDYEYVDPSDYDIPRGQRQTAIGDGYGFPKPSRIIHDDPNNPNAPDILILKHRGRTYPLHFPAYCIGEGELRIGELRKVAARETNCDPRQVKLLYKGKVLKDDTIPCRDMGLKQNSELMCVISESPLMGRPGDESSESADEDDMANGVRLERTPSRREEDSRPKKTRKNHRGGATKKREHTNGSATSTPRSSNSNLLSSDPPLPSRTSHPAATTTKPPSPPHPSSTSTSMPPPSTFNGPKTPLSLIEDISAHLYSEFVPACNDFTANPPTDAKTRDFEYKKLSESILAQILLKLDGVETGGDEETRARRKKLVRETQDLLGRLDAVGKR